MNYRCEACGRDLTPTPDVGTPDVPRMSWDCAHYVADGMDEEDNMSFLSATCACGWRCPPCPGEETRIDFLMQHAYEAGILAARLEKS